MRDYQVNPETESMPACRVSLETEWTRVYLANREIGLMQVFQASRGIEWTWVYPVNQEIESMLACLDSPETVSTLGGRGNQISVDQGDRITFKIFPAELPIAANGRIGARTI